MRTRSMFPIAATVLMLMCVCLVVHAATYAAEKYVMSQEKKNTLIKSVEENVDILRSCLSSYSRLSKCAKPFSIDPKEALEIINSTGPANK